MTAILEFDRITPLRLVAFQIVESDEPATALHFGDDQLCGFSLVEPGRPLVGDALEHGRELRVLPLRSRLQWLATRQEERGRSRELLQPLFVCSDGFGEVLIDGEAFGRELDRGCNQFLPRL